MLERPDGVARQAAGGLGWHRHQQVHHWKERYGRVDEHNAWVPRDGWLEAWEKQAIVDFHVSIRWKGIGG